MDIFAVCSINGHRIWTKCWTNDFEECTFSPATLTLTLILFLVLTLPWTENLIITLTLTLCCRRHDRISNCRLSKICQTTESEICVMSTGYLLISHAYAMYMAFIKSLIYGTAKKKRPGYLLGNLVASNMAHRDSILLQLVITKFQLNSPIG